MKHLHAIILISRNVYCSITHLEIFLLDDQRTIPILFFLLLKYIIMVKHHNIILSITVFSALTVQI